MRPKKENRVLEFSLLFIVLICCLYVAFAIGAALYDWDAVNEGQLNASHFSALLDLIEKRLANPLPEFWDCLKYQSTKKSLAIGVGVWGFAVLYYYTGKRNLIHGKEFGTSTWGKRSDISDLFSENLMKEEIRKARALLFPWGRVAEYLRVKRDCREMVDALKKAELEALENSAAAEKELGEFDAAEYEEKRSVILADAAARYEQLMDAEWKPRKIKAKYKAERKRIAEEREKGIAIPDDAAVAAAVKKAKKEKRKALRDFWSVRRRVAAIRGKYRDMDIILTETEKICLLNYKVNGHTLIIGGSGSGKSRGYVMPNTLENAGKVSFVYTDPKGELLEKAYFFLAKIKGYKVRVLNLDDKERSDGYNPFSYIHQDRPGYEERVQALIETIILNTDGGVKRQSGDPFWEKAEKLFLQALFFFTCDFYVEEEQNMETVLDLISMLEIGEEEDNRDSDLDIFAALREQELNAADTVNHTAGTKNVGIKLYKEFRGKASGKTAKSIVISAVARLAPFTSPGIQRILSYDSMELDRLGEELMAVFVVVPPTDDTFACIAGCLFTQMFQELQYCAAQVHKHDGQRLPIPVRFILDEMANTCNIPRFLKILAYARSFGISITPIFQSLDQLKVMFKDEWGSVIDNCSSTLFLGSVSNPEALEFFSKMLGKGTFDKRTMGHSRGKQGSSSWNFDVVGRELLTADEIRQLDKEKCLLMVAGRKPFYSNKYDYKNHPNYRLTSDGNRANSIEYIPIAPPWEREEIDLPHGAAEKAQERLKKTLDYINETVDFIETVPLDKLVNRVARNFEYFAPTPDELLTVNDGEPEEVTDAALFREDEELDSILTASYESRLAETKERIETEVAQTGVQLVDPVTLSKTVVQAGVNLQPTPDELLTVNDGEPEEVTEESLLSELLFDDLSEESAAQEVGDLSYSLDALFAKTEKMMEELL